MPALSRFLHSVTIASAALFIGVGCGDPGRPEDVQLLGDFGFLIERDDQFHVVDSRGRAIRTVLPAGVIGFMPDVTADGSRVVFVHAAPLPGGNHRLELAMSNVDGSGFVILAGAAESALRPRWSPGADAVAYSMSSVGDAGTYFDDLVIRSLVAGTGGVHVIEAPHDAAHALSWEPSGDRLVFERGDGGLWLVHTNGSGLQQVTSGRDRTPDWAPDGSRIAFSRTVGGTMQVCVLVLATAAESCHVAGGWGSNPRWSPDGEWLAFIGDDGGLYTVPSAGGSAAERIPGWRMQGGDYDWVRLR